MKTGISNEAILFFWDFLFFCFLRDVRSNDGGKRKIQL